MSAVITKPPILVAIAAQNGSNQNANFIGATALVVIGANIYAGLSKVGNPTYPFQVYKSTDSGATWMRMDQAHEPISVSAPIYQTVAAQDGLYFVWSDSSFLTGEALRYARFDPATDTWGAIVSTPDSIARGNFQTIARRSNGDIVVLYQAENTLFDTHWGIFSHAGVWSGENLFYASPTNSSLPACCIQGSDDTIHVLIQDESGPFNILYATLSPANAVSGTQTVVAGAVNAIEAGLPVIWNNRIIFPFGDTPIATSPQMFVGSPVSAPLWSTFPLTGVTPLVDAGWPIAFITASGALVIFETLQVFNPSHIFQLWYTPFDGGALGTPVLYYDAIANPPASGAVDDLLVVSPALLAGSIVATVAMQLGDGSFPPENAFFLRGKSCLL